MRINTLLAGAILLLGGTVAMAAPPPSQHFEGWLSETWGDAPAGQPAPVAPVYLLRRADGSVSRLQLGPGSEGAVHALAGRWVAVDGDGVAAASAQPAAKAKGVLGHKPWITLMCKFKDVADEPQPPSFLDGMMSSSRPGLDFFWRELSDGRVDLAGSRTAGWYTLPRKRAAYVYDANNDGTLDVDYEKLRRDCMDAADADVNFPDYAGINLALNADLDCCAWGGATVLDIDGVQGRSFGLTLLPPWSWQNHTSMAHEMGHGFGLPHSRGANQPNKNPWDLMSDVWTRCENDEDPVLGCLGYHTIAFHKDLLGWIPAARRHVVPAGANETLRIERLERPTDAAGYLVAIVPILGSATHFYTVEVRRLVSFDVRLHGTGGVVIHEVDTTLPEPANLVDGDDNGNPYDPGTRWSVGEVFRDAAAGISVSIDDRDTTGYTVTVRRGPDSAATR
jgi:hypothetical protein